MANQELLLETLRELIRVPSVSGEEAELGAVFADMARKLGFDVEIQPVIGRRANVLVTWRTAEAPTVLFNGHLDTLPLPAGWTRNPYEAALEGEWFYGSEANNMKAGLAAMLTALDGIRGRKGRGTVTISAVMGECDTMGLGTVSALERGLRADAAINGEPTALGVLLSHAGVTQLRIESKGHSAHVSQRSLGHNAITDLIRILSGLDERILTFVEDERFPGLPTINVGTIGGGGVPSMLADRAWADIDVRTVPGMSVESICADLERYAAVKSGNGRAPTIAVKSRPAFVNELPYAIDPDAAVVRAVVEAHQLLTGDSPRSGTLVPQVFFGTDASHLNAAGIPTCIYGPGRVADINVADERILWKEVVTAADVYEEAALRLLTARA
jgi:acetylornithine deacetylase